MEIRYKVSEAAFEVMKKLAREPQIVVEPHIYRNNKQMQKIKVWYTSKLERRIILTFDCSAI
jgi:hypothetical protein